MKEYIGDFLFYSRSRLLPEGNSLGLPVDAAQKLSNFAVCKKSIELTDPDFPNPILLPTIEHAYQLSKYLLMSDTIEQKQDFINIFTNPSLEAAEAKTLGNQDSFARFDLVFHEELWRSASKDIMRALVYQKVNKHHEIKNILRIIKRKRLRLVHYSRSDKFWGASHMGGDNNSGDYCKSQPLNGSNELGKIYHEYMDEFLVS